MVPREAVPALIGPRSRYWDHLAFSTFCVERWGQSYRRKAADHFGLSRTQVTRLASGQNSPHIETYLRMAALAGRPIGVWLQHLDRVA